MPTTSWAPTLDAVGALLRARTKNVDGKEIGTFDDTTRPTGSEASELIDQAVDRVADIIGADIDPKFYPRAGSVTVLMSAMLIELSFFPEQVASGRSPYRDIRDLYDQDIVSLTTAINTDASASDEVPGALGLKGDGGTGLENVPTSPFTQWANDREPIPPQRLRGTSWLQDW